MKKFIVLMVAMLSKEELVEMLEKAVSKWKINPTSKDFNTNITALKEKFDTLMNSDKKQKDEYISKKFKE